MDEIRKAFSHQNDQCEKCHTRVIITLKYSENQLLIFVIARKIE
jgi:hypothetical protein